MGWGQEDLGLHDRINNGEIDPDYITNRTRRAHRLYLLKRERRWYGRYYEEDVSDYVEVESVSYRRPEDQAGDGDPTDPIYSEFIIWVKPSGHSAATIKQAIYDTFRQKERCGHDYDCCGCRSHTIRDVEQIGIFEWKFRAYSSRNY